MTFLILTSRIFIPENRGSRKGNLDPSEVGIEPAGGGVEPAAPTGGHPPLPNISVLPLPVLLYCLPLLYILLPICWLPGFLFPRIGDLVTEIVDPEVAERPLIKTAYTWRWPLIQPTPGGSPSSHFCILYYNYYFYYYDNSISQYRHLYLYLPILPLSPSFKSLLSP